MTKTQIFKRIIIISALSVFGSRLVELTTFRLINFFSPDATVMTKIVVLVAAQIIAIVIPIVTMLIIVMNAIISNYKSANEDNEEL